MICHILTLEKENKNDIFFKIRGKKTKINYKREAIYILPFWLLATLYNLNLYFQLKNNTNSEFQL